jgi:hypothetical protein
MTGNTKTGNTETGSIKYTAGRGMYLNGAFLKLESTEESLELDSAEDTIMNAEGKIIYANYQPDRRSTPKIIDGYWTDKQNKRITSAVIGDYVRFHIKTENIRNGELIRFWLYDDDRFINPKEDRYKITNWRGKE